MGDRRTLSERYELIQLVARGGMAQVFEARDTALDRRVAVKALDPALATDEAAVERFRREARQVAALAHPNVVAVFDHGSDDGTHYIVMEYVGGGTLADAIREDGPLDPVRVVTTVGQVCEGLAAAHDVGIIHRDVKPANIMFDERGRAKVTDFGIARALTDVTITRTGTLLGSAAYLSPEQASGKPVDIRADIYALGCVVYEMLTGKPPFHGGSPITIATHHLRTEPAPPLAQRSDLPAALSAVVLEALAKDPDERPATAREFRDRLIAAVPAAAPTGTLALIGAAALDETLAVPGALGHARETVALDADQVAAERPRPASDRSVAPPPELVTAREAPESPLPVTPPAGARADDAEDHRSSAVRAVWALVGILVAAFVLVGILKSGDAAPTTEAQAEATEAGDGEDAGDLELVVAAADAMKATIDAGREDGWLPDRAASAFHESVNEAVEAFANGDAPAAVGYLGQLRAGIELLAAEEVISGRQSLELYEPLAFLEEQMHELRPELDAPADADPPAEVAEIVEDSGSKGKGKGKGKGQDKDDDDG